MHNIIIAGIRIGYESAHDLTQEYYLVGGRKLRTFLEGGGIVQSNWLKLYTVINGQGRLPAALGGVDWSAAVEVSWASPVRIQSASNVITAPAARRTDEWVPHGYALVDGAEVATDISSVSGDDYTLATVAGATAYELAYYPKIMMLVDQLPRQNFNARGEASSWSLSAREA